MVEWKARNCHKCGGDIFLEIDEQGWFTHCLQCGYLRSLSGVICPECGREMTGAPEGYKCSHCSHSYSPLSMTI